MKRAILLSALAFLLGFVATLAWKLGPELARPKSVDPAFRIPSPLDLVSIPTATHNAVGAVHFELPAFDLAGFVFGFDV